MKAASWDSRGALERFVFFFLSLKLRHTAIKWGDHDRVELSGHFYFRPQGVFFCIHWIWPWTMIWQRRWRLRNDLSRWMVFNPVRNGFSVRKGPGISFSRERRCLPWLGETMKFLTRRGHCRFQHLRFGSLIAFIFCFRLNWVKETRGLLYSALPKCRVAKCIFFPGRIVCTKWSMVLRKQRRRRIQDINGIFQLINVMYATLLEPV